MASFMSGMAGNVTAFNTVFTYDIDQSDIGRCARQPLSDGGHHAYSLVFLSIRAAYVATLYNNILACWNSFLEVNAP